MKWCKILTALYNLTVHFLVRHYTIMVYNNGPLFYGTPYVILSTTFNVYNCISLAIHVLYVFGFLSGTDMFYSVECHNYSL